MARRVQVAIDCENPELLAEFWSDVLGYRRREPPIGHTSWAEYSRAAATEAGEAWCVIADPDGRGPSVLFHRVKERKVAKNRVHLDISLAPGAGTGTTRPLVDREVRRLVDLGATHIHTDEDDRDYYVVMQDPEGNEFCVG